MKLKLNRWKNNHLFIGGRVVILKFVLHVISIYFLSFFKTLSDIISKNLKLFNTALLGKWVWKVTIERNEIWFEALLNIYRLENGIMSLESNGVSSWWKNICQLDIGIYVTSNEYSVERDVYKFIVNPFLIILWQKFGIR